MQFNKLKRREFITLLGGAAAAGSITSAVPAMAQQPGKLPRVGVLSPADSDATPIFDAFRKGLRDLGYVEGKTISLDFRFAKGNMDALSGLAAELVRIPVDVILADSSVATRAALDATRTIPIVIGASGDPVLLGLVASIRRPGGNVTGMTIRLEALSSKRLELLKQAFPRIASASVLMNPKSVSASLSLSATREAAGTLGIRPVPVTASTPDELRALSPAGFAGSDALTVLPDAMFWNHRATIIAAAAAAHLPAIYSEREYVDDGGLLAYGPNIPDSFRRAAGHVDRILRGANPGDLPIDEPAKFDFVVNLRTARSLGLAISPDFISAANEAIE
jgi:putative tryptophan/tyrosine transport system substrate-binding protein